MSDLPPEEQRPLPSKNSYVPGPSRLSSMSEHKEKKPKGFIWGFFLALPWMLAGGIGFSPAWAALAYLLNLPAINFLGLLLTLFGVPIILLFSRRWRKFGLGLIVGQITLVILFLMIIYSICANSHFTGI